MGDYATLRHKHFLDHARSVQASGQAMTLMVGDMTRLGHKLPKTDPERAVFFVEFHELTADFLKTFNPSIVVSPIMCKSFDCLDLAKVLEENDFAGQYRVSLHGIPLPNIIKREVRQQHPRLDFDVMHSLAHVSSQNRHM